MIAGRVTSDRQAMVSVEVQAPKGRRETVEAIVDTGFTGYVTLPADRIARLGLPLLGLRRMTVADGSPAVLMVYEVVVHWHGAALRVQALEVDGGALLGMALLDGSRLSIDVVAGGSVRIAPIDGS